MLCKEFFGSTIPISENGESVDENKRIQAILVDQSEL